MGSGIALAVGLALSAALVTGILGAPQARFSDILYQPLPPSDQVAIVAIDDKTLQEFGPLPWPRARYAELLNALWQMQPRAIAFDLVLTEEAPDNSVLRQALDGPPAVVQPIVAVDATRFPVSPSHLYRYDAALVPDSDLRAPNTILGHTTIIADVDGVVRRIPLGISVAGQTYKALGMALLDSGEQPAIAWNLESGNVQWGSRRLPVDDHASMMLTFSDPAKRSQLSAGDVLSARVDANRIKNRYLLVGVTAASAPERYSTPLRFPGRGTSPIGIQADLVDSLLRPGPLVLQNRLTSITMILLIALLAGVTLVHFRWLSAAGLTILYFVAYLGYAFQNFNQGIVVEPLYPTLALLITALATMTYRYFSQDRERSFVERLFRRHAAADTLTTVLQQFDRGIFHLRGTRRLATVLYIDLRDFAPQNQSLAAEAAIKLLSSVMADITAVIFQHNGLLLRQQGSAVLASWNIPIEQPRHAEAAAQAAVEIRNLVHGVNIELESELAIGIGMGIATGVVLAGRIGAAGFTEYTLVGEAIQVAEHLAQRRDGTIFIDAATQERLDEEAFILQQVSKMRLRRRTDPMDVWEIQEPLELEPLPEHETTHEPF